MGTISLLSDVYLVSTKDIEGVEKCSFESMMADLRTVPLLQLSLDSYEVGSSNKAIRYIALGNDSLGKRWFIDCEGQEMGILYDFLPDRFIIGHGLPYDLEYLHHNGCSCFKVRDTMFTEEMLNSTYLRKSPVDIENVVLRRTGKPLYEDVLFPNYDELSLDVIKHLVGRVIPMEKVLASQGKEAQRADVTNELTRINTNIPFIVFARCKGIDVSKYKVES